MLSRSTLLAALVVVELAILGVAAQAVSSGSSTTWNFAPGWRHHRTGPVTSRLDKTFETGGSPHVVLDVDNAAVTVRTGTANGVRVLGSTTVTGYTSGVQPALTAVRTADGVRVAVESGLVRVHGRLERAVQITVPPDASVEIASAGSVVASGLHGKLIARLDDGDVRIADQRGDVDVTTGSGDVELVDAQATAIALRTDNGALTLTSSGADHIDARTTSGAITAVDLRAVDGALQADDGHIAVGFSAQSDAAVSLHTSDGRITGVGPASSADGADSRSMRLGAARGHFSVTTASGPISVTEGANV